MVIIQAIGRVSAPHLQILSKHGRVQLYLHQGAGAPSHQVMFDLLSHPKQRLGNIHSIFAIVAISPRDAGLEQKKPYIFETPVTGGDITKQFDLRT